MTDDLVKRLRDVAGVIIGAQSQNLEEDYTVARKAADRIEKLEAALREIEEASVPRTVAIRWRSNGSPSKHDKCAHGMAMYEDCGNCIADFARKALEENDG